MHMTYNINKSKKFVLLSYYISALNNQERLICRETKQTNKNTLSALTVAVVYVYRVKWCDYQIY